MFLFFLFFFKQKTAYEMRISDWSSDVCSSDLQFAVWGESQGGHAALWTAIAAKSYAPELRLVGTAAAAPPTDLADNMRKASEPNVRALLMGFTMYSWSRSEEHTSELQSLMRISYAVFCLKKKKIKY